MVRGYPRTRSFLAKGIGLSLGKSDHCVPGTKFVIT